jgi:hypothetical protein
MEKILQGQARLVGTILSGLDTNFIDVCKYLLKIANPDYTLKGYADDSNEPASPVLNDCYLVLESGTIWELEAEENEIIYWNGYLWDILPYKITELNAVLQAFYFDADNIACVPPEGMTATNVQSAIEELAAAVFGTGEGGGSGSASV